VAATIQRGDHGGTYPGNPLACAAVATVIRVLGEEDVLDRCQTMGDIALDFLRSLRARVGEPIVDVRGRGLLIGCELSSDADASTATRRCLDEGVIVNVTRGNVLRIFPALNIDPPLLMRGLQTLQRVLMSL
jgi:acetylornithine/N-succinyldiaminopimelate aminotransferase